MQKMPYSGPVGRALLDAYRLATPEHRNSVLELIERSRDKRFVDQLFNYLESEGSKLPLEDVAKLGRVLGKLQGEKSVPNWMKWLASHGWLRRQLKEPRYRQVSAAWALSEFQGKEIEDLLFDALSISIDDAAPLIQEALTRMQARVAKGGK
jgi:hypothetical protein